MLILKRVIIEVRFLAILRFKERAYDYFQKIIEFYTDLAELKNEITLANRSECRKIYCHNLRCGITMENVAEKKLFTAEADRLVSLLNELKSQKIQRIGVRCLYLNPVDNTTYSAAIHRLANNQLKLENVVFKADDFEDFALTINGKSADYRFNTFWGVVNKREIIDKHSEFPYDEDPEIAYFSDIDVYRIDFPYSISVKTITDMADESKRLVSHFFGDNDELFKA